MKIAICSSLSIIDWSIDRIASNNSCLHFNEEWQLSSQDCSMNRNYSVQGAKKQIQMRIVNIDQ